MPAKTASAQLPILAGAFTKDPELRKRLLDYAAATGNPEDLISARKSVAGRMADDDPEAAREFVRDLQAGGKELAELDATVTEEAARKNPESAYTDWLQRNSDVAEVPATIRYGISAWLGRSSMGNHDDGEPIKWLDALPAGGQRDILYESTIPALAGFQRFDETERMAGNIDSPTLRASALNAPQTWWLLVNSQKAAMWKDGLPAEDQALMRK